MDCTDCKGWPPRRGSSRRMDYKGSWPRTGYRGSWRRRDCTGSWPHTGCTGFSRRKDYTDCMDCSSTPPPTSARNTCSMRTHRPQRRDCTGCMGSSPRTGCRGCTGFWRHRGYTGFSPRTDCRGSSQRTDYTDSWPRKGCMRQAGSVPAWVSPPATASTSVAPGWRHGRAAYRPGRHQQTGRNRPSAA